MSIENQPKKAPATYALTRFVILRLLGFVYLAAFISLAVQVLPLIGSNGLLPADDFLAQVREGLHSNGNGFLALPTIFWFGISDHLLLDLSWIGVALSAIVMLGYANAILMAILWFLYMSFVN
ncbi:MAG TPA: lipase maturation factor family protein, partial [Chthoniobacteraceae bacterium]